MTDFNPNFDHIQGDESISSPHEFARKMLVEYLRQYTLHKGITHDELAKITGLHQSNVTRIFSGKYSPTMDTFLNLAGAMSLKVYISD